ncbi:MAG: hypothetical protein WC943_15000 [Elusimicrobiota bacterium]
MKRSLLLPGSAFFLGLLFSCGRVSEAAGFFAGSKAPESLARAAAAFASETGADRAPASMLSIAHPPAVSVPYPGTPAAGALELKGFVSFWTQDCRNGCGLPKPATASLAVELRLPLPSTSGEASSASFGRKADLGPSSALMAKVTAFAICPRRTGQEGSTTRRDQTGSATSGESCPGRYFQVQVELSGAAEAFCAMSMDEHDLAPFPVLMCAGMSTSEPTTRLGVTLHRTAL